MKKPKAGPKRWRVWAMVNGSPTEVGCVEAFTEAEAVYKVEQQKGGHGRMYATVAPADAPLH